MSRLAVRLSVATAARDVICQMLSYDLQQVFTGMAADSDHDTYSFQNVTTQVGQKPLSYFVSAAPYSFCSLNFFVTACQVNKMKERTLAPKTNFTTLCCYMLCCG
jgi:hypothetical protein